MSDPTIPLNELTWEEAETRFAAAMEKIYDVEAMVTDLKKALPGAPDENVFDLPDGMRLIITLEDLSSVSGKVQFHTSSSCWSPKRRPKHVQKMSDVPVWMLENLNRVGRFDPPLTLNSDRLKKQFVSPAGIVHLWFSEGP